LAVHTDVNREVHDVHVTQVVHQVLKIVCCVVQQDDVLQVDVLQVDVLQVNALQVDVL